MMDGHGRWCHLGLLSCTGTLQDYSLQSLPADRRVWLNQGYLQATVSFMHILGSLQVAYHILRWSTLLQESHLQRCF